jgi:aspartate ammonia-lyase
MTSESRKQDRDLRVEADALGPVELPAHVRYGVHTQRALENFDLAQRPVHPALVRAYGLVKLACAVTNRKLGFFPNVTAADAVERACREMAEGHLDDEVKVDALQGGAGTSTNLSVSEVIANRALELIGAAHGSYELISPIDHVNLHQSTNDTYPTALRLAAIYALRGLEAAVVLLQEAFQDKEREYSHVVKVARTEYQDAALITLGREMSAYAEAFSRDRWRIYKCEERLRVVNLGGTAVGTGLAAPRDYILRVVDTLREESGVGLARAENLVEATQNTDVFVEVSGILKALAVSLAKTAADLRLLSSGPGAGLGEIRLPPRQAGSSIMPGKVNPVIPEAVQQAAMLVMGLDGVLAAASAAGSLELNAFMPLIADCLLTEIDLLTRACRMLRDRCVQGLEANVERCRAHVENATATATALLAVMSYDEAAAIAGEAATTGRAIRELVVEKGLLTAEEFERVTSFEAVCALGMRRRPQRTGGGGTT